MVRLSNIWTTLASTLFASAHLSLTAATPIMESSESGGAELPLAHDVVAQFPAATWIENLAVRQTGDILLTVLVPSPQLFVVPNPSARESGDRGNRTVVPTLVHTFADGGATGLVGISEIAADLFVVAGFGTTANKSTVAPVWSVDFRPGCSSLPSSPGRAPRPKVKLITSIANAGVLNGIASPPGADNLALVADSSMGLVWRVDVDTGKTDIAIQVPEMGNGDPGNPAAVGINGLRVPGDGHLYWSNSATVTIYRVKIDSATGAMERGATVEVVGAIPGASFVDDFAVSKGGGAIFAATNYDSTLVAVQPFKNQTAVVLGTPGQLTVAGATSAVWGRGADAHMLYVSTTGGIKSSVEGSPVEAGKVVGVDTTGFSLN